MGSKNKVKSFGLMKLNLQMLRLVGLRQTIEGSITYSFYTLFVMLIIVVNLFLQVMQAYSSWGDLISVTETSFLILTVTGFLCKATHMILRQSHVDDLVGRLEHELTYDCHRYCEQVINESGNRGDLLTSMITIFCMTTGTFWAVSPFIISAFNSDILMILPLKSWYPFCVSETPYYEITYAFQILSIYVFVPTYCAVTCFYVALIVHTCSRFDMLNVMLRLVSKKTVDKMSEEMVYIHLTCSYMEVKRRNRLRIPLKGKTSILEPFYERENNMAKHVTHHHHHQRDEQIDAARRVEMGRITLNYMMNQNLIQCVKYHQATLEYVKDLDAVFGPIVLINFAILMGIICQAGFQIVVGPKQIMRIIKFTTYLISSSFELLIYCWCGNEVLYKSHSVRDAAYECQWYGCDKPFKRAVQMIMLRAQRPSKLTAGKMYTMTLPTFTMIMKNAYSIFALLRQTQEK